ncbi:hypothetical protein ACWU4D_10540 [Vibrio sp. WJH972]
MIQLKQLEAMYWIFKWGNLPQPQKNFALLNSPYPNGPHLTVLDAKLTAKAP